MQYPEGMRRVSGYIGASEYNTPGVGGIGWGLYRDCDPYRRVVRESEAGKGEKEIKRLKTDNG